VIVRLPLTRLIQNTAITLAENPYFHQPCFRDSFFFHRLRVVGSCNGLLCLYGYVVGSSNCYEEIFLYLWNPATKALSNKIVFLQDELHLRKFERTFWFGYDNSTDNYKIVAFCLMINEVRVLNLGDNVWRYIQSWFPLTLFPLCLSDNGDTLIVVCEQHHSAILYNLKYDRGENIRISNLIQWFCAQNYIESLVPTS
jgi:hypothetical protein